MNIQELEKMLNTTRANIRFYEKQGLINPNRKENGYRDYSENDIRQLKKIIVFRKLGVPIAEIKKVLDGELSVDFAVEKNIAVLEKQLNELNGALKISNCLKKELADNGSFDEEKYFELINYNEEQGDRFIDILKDYKEQELGTFIDGLKYYFGTDLSKVLLKWGLSGVITAVLLILLIRGIIASCVTHTDTFVHSFFSPFITIGIGFAVSFFIYYLARKDTKLSRILINIIFILVVLTIFAVVLLVLIVIILAVKSKTAGA
ncbi:MAG: MerR family transcriptional regulator [Acetobacter sp.]|nr:MerR family transcriptional regulator [Bacteroides sp.]MCM1341523.1 MerR family transcriptional regulator [Acetobacter sp.]MCM1433689.1 MerR family transcriptional regulator [Clostridiales bacterium]